MSLEPFKLFPAVPVFLSAVVPAVLRRPFPPAPLLLASIFSGVLLALAFPPVSVGVLSFFSLVPLVVTLYRGTYRHGDFFKAGYLFGVTFFLAHLWWIVRLVPAASITMPWLMGPALVALVAYLAVYPALFFLLLRVIVRGDRHLLWLVGPPLWALLEWIRSNGELGFPWAAIGYSFARIPVLLQGASYLGITGVGAFIILINMVLSSSLLTRNIKTKSIWIAASMVLLMLAHVFGRHEIDGFDGRTHGAEFRVAVVQPDVDLAVKWDPAFTDSTFRLIDRLSHQAARSNPGLIVFPETSAPVYLRHNLKYRMIMERLAANLGVGVFIGFLDGRYDGPGGTLRVYNSAGLIFADGGGIQVYDKMHLLPFGEAIPFAWKFPALAKVDFGQANFTPGPPVDPIESPVGRLAPLVCFESIFPGLSRRFTRLGADVIVNVTNDGWFGDTPGPYQHNDMAILRAVENHRFLVRSANTGISMFVDPVGRVKTAMGTNREGVLVDRIFHVDETTFYTRHGDGPLLISSLLAVVCGGIAAGYRRRARRRGTTL